MALCGTLWPNLAVIDPNSFGLVLFIRRTFTEGVEQAKPTAHYDSSAGCAAMRSVGSLKNGPAKYQCFTIS